ncbi:MAG: glycosyltransferase [Elusimicrobiota bacterium]
MAGKIDISAVIVNWNTKPFLEGCIESLLADRGDFALQIIVVDNASTDGSQVITKDLYFSGIF